MIPDATAPATPHVIDVTTEQFEAAVLQKSLQTPVLVDFHADWCEPCKQLAPVLEKLAADYNGAFVLARVDAEKEQQITAALQVRSLPTVILLKDGQPLDGFPGVLPEAKIRELLKHHGIEPAAPPEDAQSPEAGVPADPHDEVVRLRAELAAAPDAAELKLDLAVALSRTGEAAEAQSLLDALPANLATDERSVHARARLAFIALAAGAPPIEQLEKTVAADPDDLHARHLLGARSIASGEPEAGLQQFIEMLRRDRSFSDGLPRRVLIDAFRVIDDAALVGRYRRRMSSLLF